MYIKLNSDPIPIETIGDCGETEYDIGFNWQGRTYWMCDFIRTHNNPWIGDNFPEYIHGMHESVFDFYVELINGDEAVNIYEYKEEE